MSQLKQSLRRVGKSRVRAADIRRAMLGILRANQKGLPLVDLVRKIEESLPGAKEARIRSTIWLFSRRQATIVAKGRKPEFVQPKWGVYRIYADEKSDVASWERTVVEASELPFVGVKIDLGDAIAAPADVLVLKYAQQRFGVDARVDGMFQEAGRNLPKPKAGKTSKLIKSVDGMKASHVLVVGTPNFWEFDYSDVQNFSRLALSELANAHAPIRRVVMTLHGTGFGLDRVEAFEHEIAGLRDAVQGGQFPTSLESVSIVENKAVKAELLDERLHAILPEGKIIPQLGIVRHMHADFTDISGARGRGHRGVIGARIRGLHRVTLPSPKSASKKKNTVFVAMPFMLPGMDDLYHYGIVGGAHKAGFICERADTEHFTGDMLKWIRHRIENAAYVIAVLTGANANVYLEVGYAWGRDIPCLLFADNKKDLKFNVAGQKCIFYNGIREMEKKLAEALQALQRRS